MLGYITNTCFCKEFFNFMVFIFPRVTRQLRGNLDMNVLQAVWAAVQCKHVPPINSGDGFNLGGTPPAGGTGSINRGPRNISGLNGTPSSYNGRRVRGNRSGQGPNPNPLTATSSLAAGNISSDALETRPTNNSKKVGFSEPESVTDESTTREGLSHQPPSILRKSHLSVNSASYKSFENDDGLLAEPKSVLDGSAALLEFLPENDTLSAEAEEQLEVNTDIDVVGLPEEAFSFK